MKNIDRRAFLRTAAVAGAASLLGHSPAAASPDPAGEKKFRISLAAWSLNPSFGKEWKNIDLPRIVREEFGLDGVEFVNRYFELPLLGYLKELKKQAADNGVECVLIMVDDEGDMSHEDSREREQAIIQHRKWIDIAHFLGCHAIRANAGYTRQGTVQERIARCADSYRRLMEYADGSGLEVVIENHGGWSSEPDRLISLVEQVGHPNFGTLPDFGNFPEGMDKYEAVRKLMPHAKAVSAKCYDFAPDGTHERFDLGRMVEIVLDAGYRGFIGIEYEGRRMSPHDGVMACRRVLERYQ